MEAGWLELRRAAAGDAPALAAHRLELVRSVKAPDAEAEERLRLELEGLIERDLDSGELAAWLCLDGEKAAASGCIAFPRNAALREEEGLGPGEALLLGMYTRPAYRRRGLAAAILGAATAEARSRGASAIRLQPTDLGKPIYEAAGFRDSGRGMLLELRLRPALRGYRAQRGRAPGHS